mmetsp:Transcript_57494/g.122017  ORF Transcript_57494/g.122017 Transcript_57494/m.122017 type:complete len:111 (+) Transcript_57494:105-437(+)|eukprot:CAMPEP_0172557192 /NCGR_PEP_ID=MMETSP1067-20121228/71876_1 /TAXON_ID=265564 ORGANISM="Thalassiosira punctigera, Strain Tpunct2005C2" /NCGR_SAMPLE_ID=MMETSP1067 /ASSEMBLY_ACC=CAM_ASM_000444 /LENGTH=110 /DNA_ID=CAMNT_0013346211 /DNA_START=103 /DNA_END=435 /DNA_ORIENTATION=+
MLTEAEVSEINTYFKAQMAEKQKIWAARGKDARMAAITKKASGTPTWRQMSGMRLMMHEIGHVGNRPFMVGLGVTAIGALWIQTKFTDEMRKDSLYWSTYHGDGAAKGGH